MSVCKECLHYEVCGLKKEIISTGIRVIDSNTVENICPHFEDRLQYVKLPCKVGAKIYKICPQSPSIHYGDMWDGKIVETPCQRCPWQSCSCKDIGYHKGFEHIIRAFIAEDELYILARKKYFGTVYFPTCAEAEQVLKEREKNDKL